MRYYDVISCVAILIAILGITSFMDYKKHEVPPFTDDNCIKALVGEYARIDAHGMCLMAHAIRNRGTLKGVYGFNAPHSRTENKFVWELASLAWFDSEYGQDPLNGANEWRSIQDIKRHGHPKKLRLIQVYGGIYYYKKI